MEPATNGIRIAWVASSLFVLFSVGGGIFYVSTHARSVLVAPPAQPVQISENNIATTTKENVQLTGIIQPVSEIATETPTAVAKIVSTSSTSSIRTKSEVVKVSKTPTDPPHPDWGTVRSASGFSLQYPYKEIGAMWGDDEYFQVAFFFPATIISLEATSSEKLSSDIHNIGLYGGLNITVIKATTTVSGFDDWIKVYLKKEDSHYGNHEKVLSERETETFFAGLSARQFTRSIEGDKSQGSPHYARKEIFARDASYVYRITHLAPSGDTVFPRSGVSGKDYLTAVDALSEKVLKTFIFDKSKNNSITVPKVLPRPLTGAALTRREKLLSALRTEPFYDVHVTYPEDSSEKMCTSGIFQDSGSSSPRSLTPAPGIFIAANDKSADLNGYDANGGHTGPMPMIPGLGYRAPIEEQAWGIDSLDLGWSGYGLFIDESINGRIELVGKKFDKITFQINGDGNDCSIVEMRLYVTPYSVATLPMTARGDLGPISYDIDGDGIKDFEISLLHPMLPQKEKELIAVLSDMQSTEHWEMSN